MKLTNADYYYLLSFLILIIGIIVDEIIDKRG